MEQFRTIRVILAPFVLFGSLILGAHFANKLNLDGLDAQRIAAISAIGATALLPLGFIIGGIATAFLWAMHLVTPHKFDRFEVSLSPAAWKEVWAQGGVKGRPYNKHDRVWASAIWIRTTVPERVHELAERRWHAANAHFNAFIAVMLSYAIGPWLLDISVTPQWLVWSGIPAVLFLALCILPRAESSRIIEFATTLPEEDRYGQRTAKRR